MTERPLLDHARLVQLEERLTRAETELAELRAFAAHVSVFFQAMLAEPDDVAFDDDVYGGEAFEEERWRRAHVAARARRQREREDAP